MPASCASAGVGYWQPTHGTSCGQSRTRVVAPHPFQIVRENTLECGSNGSLEPADPLGRDCDDLARVLRRVDRDQAVRVLECVGLDRRQRVEQLIGRLEDPREVSSEVGSHECVGAALPDQPRHLVDERPPQRPARDDHLPAGLDPDTGVDEDLRVSLEPGIAHA
jgi:hypothetical protein